MVKNKIRNTFFFLNLLKPVKPYEPDETCEPTSHTAITAPNSRKKMKNDRENLIKHVHSSCTMYMELADRCRMLTTLTLK